MVDCLCDLGDLPMKLVLGIASVLGLLMLAEGRIMIALMFAFAVWLALPLFDWFSLSLRAESRAAH